MPVRKRKHTEFLESFEPEISDSVKLQTQTHSKSSKKRASSSSPLKPVGQAGFQRPAFQPVILRPFKRRISTDLPKESLFQVFQLFCPVHLVQQWVEFINLRHISLPGRAEGPRSKYSRYNTWDPTSVDEIYLFLGILIYMSVHQEPAVIDYWSTSPTDPIHPITRFMPRNRFQALYRRFCIWDPTETKSTVFQKVAEWSQYIQLRSIEYWKPASSVSIDEAMWSFHRKGYGPVNYDAIPSLGLAPTQGIVADLLRRLPPPPSTSHGYHCYMDNLFATPQLFEYLRSQGIAATGTTRPARIDSNQLQKLRTQESRRDTIPWGTLYARKSLKDLYECTNSTRTI
ncbi:transposase IS4 domain-containing protein [Metarhizium brunneum]